MNKLGFVDEKEYVERRMEEADVDRYCLMPCSL